MQNEVPVLEINFKHFLFVLYYSYEWALPVFIVFLNVLLNDEHLI